MFYMEVSAKTGFNINELFFKIASEANELWRKKQIATTMQQSVSASQDSSIAALSSKQESAPIKLGVPLDESYEQQVQKKSCRC